MRHAPEAAYAAYAAKAGCTDLANGVGQVVGAGQRSSSRAPYARDALYVRLRGRLQTQDSGFRDDFQGFQVWGSVSGCVGSCTAKPQPGQLPAEQLMVTGPVLVSIRSGDSADVLECLQPIAATKMASMTRLLCSFSLQGAPALTGAWCKMLVRAHLVLAVFL